jgi:PAS domain S-box-containing protein
MGNKVKKILLVEDEAIIAMRESLELKEAGYSVQQVSSGEVAVTRLQSREEMPDLILMDIDLGRGMDGTETAAIILKKHDVPIVFLSSHTEKTIVEKTEKITSYGYVVKNSGLTVLDASIKMAFKLHEAHLSNKQSRAEIGIANEELNASIENLKATNDKLEKAYRALATKDELLSMTGRIGRIGSWEYDPATAKFEWSEEIYRIHDIDPTEPIDLKSTIGCYVGESRIEIRKAFRSLFESKKEFDLEFEIETAQGIRKWVRTIGKSGIGDGREEKQYGTMQDVTERKLAELEVRKTNRVYTVISQINQMIVRARDKEEIYREACRIAVEYGGFLLAWVGLLDGEGKTVVPVAWTGNRVYLDKLKFIPVDDTAWGNGPTGLAVKRGRYYACNDIATDPHMAPWRDAALESGFRSSISLPFTVEGKTIGAFTLYSSTASFFSEQETRLLDEVTRDISFAIETLENDARRKAAETALRQSEEHYRFLTENMKDVVWTLDTETMRFLYVSPSVQRLRGYSTEEIMAGPVDAALTPETAEALKTSIRQRAAEFIAEGRKPEAFYTDEVEQPCRNGGTVWTEVITRFDISKETGHVLSHGVTRDITDRRRLREEYRIKAEELENFFSLSLDLLCIGNTTGHFLKLNAAWEKNMGYTLAELEGIRFLDLVHPDDLQSTLDAVDSLKNQEDVVALVNRYRHRDGSYRWIEWHSHSSGTLVYAVASDITEHRKTEEALRSLVTQKETLMKELQHRVKNNLGIISSLLSLESGRLSEESSREILDNAINRIQAITSLYERLYRSPDLASIDIALYIEDLTDSIFKTINIDGDRIRLTTRIEQISLDMRHTVPLGLILNELIMNALKYAYPGDTGGTIHVELESSGTTITLKVSDEGVGLPELLDPDASSGLGFSLVSLLAGQLGGEVRVERGKGTHVAVSFPI